MDSFKFHDVRVEKSNSAAKYSRIQKIASLFRFMELLIFFIALSKYSPHLLSSLKLSGEYFRSIPAVSSRSVFVVGNAIVIVLFFISGKFSGERSADFYEEYVEKCRNNHQKRFVPFDQGKAMMSRSRSAVGMEERRRELRRSVSEKSGKKKADEMSGEEFRRTVEAFIARQQKCLREEEEFSFKA